MKSVALLGLLFSGVLAILLFASGVFAPHANRTVAGDEQISTASQQLTEVVSEAAVDAAPPGPEVQVDVVPAAPRKHKRIAKVLPPQVSTERAVIKAPVQEKPITVVVKPKPAPQVEPAPTNVPEAKPVVVERVDPKPRVEQIAGRNEEPADQKLRRELEENRAWRRAKLAQWAKEEAERKKSERP